MWRTEEKVAKDQEKKEEAHEMGLTDTVLSVTVQLDSKKKGSQIERISGSYLLLTTHAFTW